MKRGKNVSIYIPLIIIDAFILFSVLLFMFGTVEWLTPNMAKEMLFIAAVYLLFSAGYFFIIKRSKSAIKEYENFDFFKIAMLIFVVGCSVMIVYYIANIIMVYGQHIFQFLRYPGAAYDYQEYMQRLYSSGKGLEYPMWFRYISRVNTLLYGMVMSAIPLGVFYFKRLNWSKRVLLFVAILIYAVGNWLVGAQMPFFFLLFISITYYLYRIYLILISTEKKNKKIKGAITQTLSLIGIGIVCLAIIFIFQHDRQIQRNIRTEINNELFKSGYKMNDETWDNIILRSINIRFGEDVFIVKYDDLESSGKSNNVIPKESMEDKLNENVEYNKKVEDLKMNGINSYYTIKKDTSLLYKISPSLFYAIESIEIYQTQGYGALGLAFEHNFEWTYFIGNTKYVTTMIDQRFGTNIAEKTYVYKNEKIYGWSMSTYWQTLYTWLASDFSFVGVILLFGLIGMLFAKSWLEIIRYKNPFAFLLMYFMIIGIIMASANNFLFQDLIMIIATVSVLFMFAMSLIIRKRSVKIEANDNE